MTTRIEEQLRRLHGEPVAPSAEHRERLERELLAAHEARPRSPAPARRSRWAPLLAAAALLLGVLAAARAPADYAVDVGQRIEVRPAPGAQLPLGPELARVVEEQLSRAPGRDQERREAAVQVLRTPHGQPLLRIDVWGPVAGDLEGALRALPSLRDADVRARVLSGRVRTSVAGLLGHRLLRLRSDPAAIEAARAALQRELELDGSKGTVDIEVDDLGPGKQRVRVRVNKETSVP
jgi:hypothetical protein